MDSWHYVKMSVVARRKLAEAIRQKIRVLYNGVMVRYTSTTVNLLNAILEHADRQTARARLSFRVLMDITGISSRETIARHVFLLESAGCVRVKRAKVARDLNATNWFELINETASAFLGTRWTPSGIKNRTDIYEYDNRTDNNKNMMDDTDITPLSDGLADKVKTILDEHMTQKVIKQYGADVVDGWYKWVMAEVAKGWVSNPGGLLVAKLRTGKNPPSEAESKQPRKAKKREISEEERNAQWEAEIMEYGKLKDQSEAELAKPLPDWVMALEWDLSRQAGMHVTVSAKWRAVGIVDVLISENVWAVWGKDAVHDMISSFANRHGIELWSIVAYPHNEKSYWIDKYFSKAVARLRPQTVLIDGRLVVMYHPHALRGNLLEQVQVMLVDMWRDRFGVDAVLVPVVQAERLAV